MSESLKVLVTTFAKEADATTAVRTLVLERLAACGTLIHRARSIYVWQERIEDTEEIVVLIKTSPERSASAAARLRELHPYECPEVLALDAASLNPAYAAWIAAATADPA